MVVAAAMPRELRPLVRALSMRRRDVAGLRAWRGRGVVAVAVGVGPDRASESVAGLLEALEARFVLVTGVAGALDPSLRVGDLVVPAEVVDGRSGRTFRPHPAEAGSADLQARAAGATTSGTLTSGPVARRGVLRSVSRIDEATSGRPFGEIAVDMETAAIAEQCERRGVPWDVRRAVSDLPGTVSVAVGESLRSDGTVDLRTLLAAVARHPREVVAIARLGRGARQAVSRATAAVVEVLEATGALLPDDG